MENSYELKQWKVDALKQLGVINSDEVVEVAESWNLAAVEGCGDTFCYKHSKMMLDWADVLIDLNYLELYYQVLTEDNTLCPDLLRSIAKTATHCADTMTRIGSMSKTPFDDVEPDNIVVEPDYLDAVDDLYY